MSDEKHKWRVTDSSYRMSFDHQPIVIYYCPNPGGTKHEDGSTSYSLSFPALLMSEYVTEPEKAAQAICDALNEENRVASALADSKNVERHPGPFMGPDAELARACAMSVLEYYGNDDPDTHQRILKNGIWNDHVAVQAALAAIHHIRNYKPPHPAPAEPQE